MWIMKLSLAFSTSSHLLYLNSSHRVYNLSAVPENKGCYPITQHCSLQHRPSKGCWRSESGTFLGSEGHTLGICFSIDLLDFFNSSDCIKGCQSMSSTPAFSRHHSTCILYISFYVNKSHMLPFSRILCRSCESHVCI